MRDVIPEIRALGVDVVTIGNGQPHFARAFRDEHALDVPLLTDPGLSSYEAAGLRRGVFDALKPAMLKSAVRAWRAGHRQTGVEGDAWQLGGVLVLDANNSLVYHHVANEAGDQAPPDELLAASRKASGTERLDAAPGAQ